jgi:hypothetical protein
VHPIKWGLIMGLLRLDEEFEKISEEKIKKILLDLKMCEPKELSAGNFDYFINFLKQGLFITEYICTKELDKSKPFLIKLTNVFCLKNINIDELLELIKINATLELTKVTDWRTTEIPLLSEIPHDEKIKCHSAEFKEVNKWGYEGEKETYKVMYYGDKVIWISSGVSFDEPQYYIIQKDKVYGIKYNHKKLTIHKNLNSSFEEILGISLDDIITKHRYTDFNINSTEIDLSNYFYTGFFYKGMLFGRNWEGEISAIKNINFENGLLKIEIENLTYPHTGYILLELGSNKIIGEQTT